MKTKPVIFLIALLLSVSYCQSQDAPLGQWKDYFSYQDGLTVCEGGGNVYCCTSSGVFAYNLSDNSVQRYNKVTGLSDIGCTVARYNALTNTLVIGYSNGNIDLLSNNRITNISDLKNSSVQGSKAINNIYFSNNLAYLSCGQGILILDLNQNIVLNLYQIGTYGSALNVYSSTIFNDTLFAATVKGIYKISVNDPNPDDYADWQVISSRLPKGVYNGIVNCGDKMYASFSKRLSTHDTAYDRDSLFVYNSGKWSNGDTALHDNIYSIESATVNNIPYLIYTGAGSTNVIDSSAKIILHIFNYGFASNVSPNDAILDNNMTLWIADANYGLVHSSNSFNGESYIPPGPFSNSAFSMAAQGPYLYIAPGGYDQSFVPLYVSGVGISEYSDNSWYRLIDNSSPDSIRDLCCVAIDPRNSSHAFAGCWGSGVVEYNNNAVTNVYDPSNSSLQSQDAVANFYSVRVGGVAFDSNGNLWVANALVNSNYLSVRHADGTWQSFNFSGIVGVPQQATVTQIIVTKTGAKWLVFPRTGILAYQDNGTFAAPNASNSVFITTSVGNGDLPTLSVYCLAEDHNGAIWVGNNTQVVVFYSPDAVFNGPGGWDAQNVYVQQTGYTQYLMQDQYSNCITIDGANRKWIGTLGGGIFLMSADGTQQIYNFTTANSPLPSNNILSIAINEQTGEVFIGTDEGTVSFHGTATEGNSSFSGVYAFPDPVPHGYTGPIAIKNLVANSDVKIATINGEVVYHTIALGGQAVWNGTNFNGERVQTGVYLVFCVSPDGSQSTVTKLLFIN